MRDPAGVSFRAAGRDDARAVAELHADSWRRHYRAAYSDAFLDGDVVGYLLPLWTDRLGATQPRSRHTRSGPMMTPFQSYSKPCAV